VAQKFHFEILRIEVTRALRGLSAIAELLIFLATGRNISERSSDPLYGHFLFQRITVLIQRLNSILFHETFPAEDPIDM